MPRRDSYASWGWPGVSNQITRRPDATDGKQKNPGYAGGFLLLETYQLTLAPPAKIAPSRPTTTTSSFFLSTTPQMIPRQPRRGLPWFLSRYRRPART